jgi:branched-chain amino acid transport system permease protein
MRKKWAEVFGLGILLLAIFAVPFVAGDSLVYFLTLVMIWSIFAIGFDLVFGTTGLPSLGHAAFFGSGAYTMALLMIKCGLPFSLALIAGGFVAALVALFFGFISLRVSGLFFALTTLAFAGVLSTAALTKLRFLTGGFDGLPGVPRPAFFGINFYNNDAYYFLVACIFLLTIGAAKTIRSSPFGQVLKGILQNEVRAEQIGFNVKRFKLSIFIISGFFSGIAGGLLGSLMLFVDAQTLNWATSADVLFMTIIGGMGTLFGPVLGVVFFEVLRDVLSSFTMHWHGLLGVIFIFYCIFVPDGMMGLVKRGWQIMVDRFGES